MNQDQPALAADADQFRLMTPFVSEHVDGQWRLAEYAKDDERQLIKLNERDLKRYAGSDGSPLIVRDHLKDLAVVIRTADCGADCRCAVEVIAIWPLLLMRDYDE